MITKVGILGASGRMGRMLIKTISEHSSATLVATCDQPGADVIGQDAGQLAGLQISGLIVGDDPKAVFNAADVVIDFTHFSATPTTLALAQETNTALFLGTTGLPDETQAAVEACAKHIPVIKAANTSLGVNLLTLLVEQAARALDLSFDIEIAEIHHNKKVDAPSGTALLLGEAAAKGREQALQDVACYERVGHTGARPVGEIGFATLRGGDIAGEHTVMLIGEQERIELSHRATSRTIFAAGALKGALWLANQSKPGYYSMNDVLGLSA